MSQVGRGFAEVTAKIVVACAADKNYSLPLSVTVRSAAERLQPGVRLQLFLMDGGLTEPCHQRLRESWRDLPVDVSLLQPDRGRLRSLKTSNHINELTYYRILLADCLPDDLERVIYLDSDLLVRKDLASLWELDLTDVACLAAQDCAVPYVDNRHALANYAYCRRFLGHSTPIANYQSLGLSSTGKYFNAGVILVNLAYWRESQVSQRCLDCLKDNESYVLWWDQYALNVVLNTSVKFIDTRWNQTAHIYEYPDFRFSPFSEAAFTEILSDPWIVHFSSPTKPWQPGCTHPMSDEFFETLGRTAWGLPKLKGAQNMKRHLQRLSLRLYRRVRFTIDTRRLAPPSSN